MHVRIASPTDVDRLDLIQAVAGTQALVKAERKYHRRTFRHHPAMEQLSKRLITAYERSMDRMFEAFTKYIGTKIVPGTKIKKSDDDSMVAFASDDKDIARLQSEQRFALLAPEQLEDLKQIVRDHHSAFAVGTFGPDAIPPQELQRLQSYGILPEDLRVVFQSPTGLPPELHVTDLAFQYGYGLGDSSQREAVKKMALDDYSKHLKKTRPSYSEVDRQAMAWARYNAGQHIRAIGDRLANNAGTVIANEDAELRRKYMGTVRSELEKNIDKKETWRKLASEIGHATEDWSRDMGRLAATEQQTAMQEGTARAISKGRDPDDVRVAKEPAPDACDECVRLHLTGGRGSKPRIFKMSELAENGTNVGRKQADWKAVIGATHPWCGCQLVEVPDGWAFNEEGDMVPEIMLKKGDRLDQAAEHFQKGPEAADKPYMTFGDAVPTKGLTVRVSDPQARKVIETVTSEAPPEIFDREVGVTLVTTDTPRAQNPLEDHDYAYWTANEIRISQTLPIERLPRVIRHELGHSLNVWLMRKFGGAKPVRAWHDRLWDVSKEEGFVSDYAKKLPIENAAEVTRMWIFEKPRLMLNHPRQFAFVNRAYKDILKRGGR